MKHTKVVSDAVEDVWNMMECAWNTAENISNMVEGMGNMMEDMCARGLIWAAHKSCPHNDNEEVEENTEQGDTKDN